MKTACLLLLLLLYVVVVPEAEAGRRRKNTRTYYHYTDRTGFNGINNVGYIRASIAAQGGNCRYGDGVYLTTVPPSAGKLAAAQANYNANAAPAMVRRGKVDYVFAVNLPEHRVRKCSRNRKVYLFRGDLYRNQFPYTGYAVRKP